jgi:hypothetical protein
LRPHLDARAVCARCACSRPSAVTSLAPALARRVRLDHVRARGICSRCVPRLSSVRASRVCPRPRRAALRRSPSRLPLRVLVRRVRPCVRLSRVRAHGACPRVQPVCSHSPRTPPPSSVRVHASRLRLLVVQPLPHSRLWAPLHVLARRVRPCVRLDRIRARAHPSRPPSPLSLPFNAAAASGGGRCVAVAAATVVAVELPVVIAQPQPLSLSLGAFAPCLRLLPCGAIVCSRVLGWLHSRPWPCCGGDEKGVGKIRLWTISRDFHIWKGPVGPTKL